MRILIVSLLIVYSTVLIGQNWSLTYTNNQSIKQFAINENEDQIAIADASGLRLIYDDENAAFTSVSYSFNNDEYMADLTRIKDIEVADNDLIYVSTLDSSILLFYELEFYGGIPVFMIDDELTTDTYLCLFKAQGTQGEIGYDSPLIGYFDIEDGDIYIDCDVENCFVQPIHPSIYSYDRTSVFINSQSLSLINYLNSEDQFYNPFNPVQMPFNQANDAVLWNLVDYPGTPYRHKLHLWLATDEGLAVYKSLEGLNDYDDWEEVEWTIYNSENSPVLGDNMDQLERIKEPFGYHKNHLVGKSSDPFPALYFIDGSRNAAICRFDNSNSPITSGEEISDLYSNFRESIFYSQGSRIHELDFSEYQCDHEITAVTEPTYVADLLVINNTGDHQLHISLNSNYFSDVSVSIEIFNSIGMCIAKDNAHTSMDVNVLNWYSGIYFVSVSVEGGFVVCEKVILP